MRPLTLVVAAFVMAVAPCPSVAQVRQVPPSPAPATPQAHPMMTQPKLGIAVPILDTTKVTIGSSEFSIYRPALRVSLAWSGTGTNVVWRWQVTDRPFGTDASLAPIGLLSAGDAAGESFPIDFGSFPPLGATAGRVRVPAPPPAQGAQPAAPVERVQREAGNTFYVRILPVQNGRVVGMPSNTVVVHFVPGPDPSQAQTRGANVAAADAAAKADSERVAREVFATTIVSFKGAVFPDPNKWGCVTVIKNPYAYTAVHPLVGYPAGQTYCGKSWKGGNQPGFWDYATAWIKVYEIMANFYDDTKSWVAEHLAQALPCSWLGKSAEQTCHDAAKELAGAAISAGLVAAGVPPSMPSVADMEDIAKGKVVDGAVAFTCDAIKQQGGTCTPAMELALQKAYQAGLGKLQAELTKEVHEPGCGNEQEAHANGVEPLPCFTSYPGTQVKPGPGSVYEPPMTVVRVTRVKPNPPLPMGRCRATLDLWVHNHFNGGYLQGANIGPTDMDGAPFENAYEYVSRLGVGQSLNMTLVFNNVRPFSIPGHFGTPSAGFTDDWLHLYHGGKGKLSAGLSAPDPAHHSGTTCGTGAQKDVQLQ